MAAAMDADREAFLGELLIWLMADPGWSQLGGQLAGAEQEDRLGILSDAFAERATGTLRQRVSSLRMFGKWKGAVIPYAEQECYDFVRHLRHINAPPTRGRTFIGSSTLLAAISNAKCLDDIVKSARLNGCAYSQLQHGRMRQQRDPLTVSQVMALENLLMLSAPGPEACVLGHILFTLHSCARWSEVLPLLDEPKLDDTVISAESKRTKTSKGVKRLRVPVPYLAMARGLSNQPWAERWIGARNTCAMTTDPSILSLNSELQFDSKFMPSEEAGTKLADFLSRAHAPVHSGQRIGTHSLK
eukprot:4089978-Amphidinium_carterae.1